MLTAVVSTGAPSFFHKPTAAGKTHKSTVAGKTYTDLRGILSEPASNATSNVVAVLNDWRGERKPCMLTTTNATLVHEIREFVAQGVTVVVTGEPGADAFTVTGIRADGRKARGGDAQSTDSKDALPVITWGGVPSDGDR